MIGIFKHKTPANLFLLLTVGVLIKLPIFYNPHLPVVLNNEGVLYRELLKILKPFGDVYPVIYSLITFTLLFTQAVSLTRIFNDQRMMNKPTYLVGLAYLLITSMVTEWNYFSAPLLVNTFLIIILGAVFKLYHLQNGQGKIFNIGLFIGIISFIFLPATLFIIWVLLGLLIMRPFKITEWVLPVLGLITPFYFFGVYLFFTDQWDLQKMIPFFNFSSPVLQKTYWFAYAVFLIAIPFFIAFFYVQSYWGRMIIQVRKNWSLVLLFLFTAILIPFVNGSNTYENWIFLVIPVAGFHAFAYLYPVKPWFSIIMFWLTILYILAFQYYGQGWG